jgi:hypothetical protein
VFRASFPSLGDKRPIDMTLFCVSIWNDCCWFTGRPYSATLHYHIIGVIIQFVFGPNSGNLQSLLRDRQHFKHQESYNFKQIPRDPGTKS